MTLLAALFLVGSGCGGGGGSGSNSERPLPQVPLTVITNNTSAGTDAGLSLLPVAGLDYGTRGKSTLWGTKDDAGVPLSLLQGYHKDSAAGVRVFYNLDGYPTLMKLDDTGEQVVMRWTPEHADVLLYGADNKYVGASRITRDGTRFKTEILEGTGTTGAFSGSVTGPDDGLLTFTVGGGGGPLGRATDPKQLLDRDVIGKPRASSRDANSERASLRRLGEEVEGYDRFAQDLLIVSANGFLENKTPTVLQQAVEAAAGGTAIEDDVTEAAPTIVAATVMKSVMAINAGLAETGKKQATFSNQAPTPNTVLDASGFAPLEGEPAGDQKVTGVLVTPRLGTVTLTGTVEKNGDIKITGRSAAGNSVDIRGTFAQTVASGTWNVTGLTPKTRENGDWNAGPANLGTCAALQQSGGQGIYTKVFQLGKKCGRFNVSWEMYSIPDQLEIFYENKTIFTTGGLVSGGGSRTVEFSGNSGFVVVVLSGPNDGTAWDYTVGCPE